MTKRAKILSVVTVCLLVVSTMGYLGYRAAIRGGALEDVAELVPDNSFMFLASRGAGDLSLEFSGLAAALADAGPRTQTAIEILTELTTEFLGFNALSVDGWQKSGIGFFSPIGYATFDSVDAFRGDALLLIPIGDQQALMETATQVVESLGGVVNLEEIPSRQIWETYGASVWGRDLNLAWIIENDYLVASISLAEGFAPVPRLMSIYDENSTTMLSDLDSFLEIEEKASDDWHNFGYVSPSGLADYSTIMSRDAVNSSLSIPPFLPSGSFGFYTHFNDTDISTSIIVPGLSDSAASTLSTLVDSGKDSFSGQLTLDPLILGRISLSIEDLWSTAVSYDPSIEAIATSGLSVLGVNFEEDILNNLTGDTSFIVASERAPDGLPSTVIHTRIKREAPLRSFIQTACPMLLTHLGFSNFENDYGVACQSEMGSFGTLDSHIVASNNPVIIRGDYNSGGLSERLPDVAWSEQAEGAPFYIYVDINKTVDLISSGDLNAMRQYYTGPMSSSILSQIGSIQSNFDLTVLPVEALGLSLEATGNVVEITGHIYPAGGSLVAWIGSGLELLLSPSTQGPSVDLKRELAIAVESLAGMVTVYKMFEDSYISCGSDEMAAAYRSTPGQWEPDQTTLDCLSGDLDWATEEVPRGAYWVTIVEAANSDQSFLAHGLSQIDGEFIYFQAGPNGQAVEIVQ